ncbi:inner-membrane translocator [Desulfurivibrio sp. D14AmB]|uniref:inner-membrane translocator n=1 Tax=Desulfurivibrio sp. D14AmB TaxID=3374370 RepID=UPI00376F2A6B
MRQIIGPAILALIYLLAACRYYPGQPLETLLATGSHLARSLPVAIATAYLVVLVMRKVSGATPAWPGRAKIFLVIALSFEFLYALHHYYRV